MDERDKTTAEGGMFLVNDIHLNTVSLRRDLADSMI